MKRGKNSYFYLTVFNLLKNGKNPAKIKKELNISKQALNYYLSSLKHSGFIRKIGYGTWEVKVKEVKERWLKDPLPTSKNLKQKVYKVPTNKNLKQKIEVRGHAFIWSIKLPEEIKNWDKRIEILSKNGIDFKLVGISKKTPRIWIDNKKVWLGNKTITIFETGSFYAKNSIDSRKYAVISLIETLKKIERKLNINLHPYMFRPSREHFGLIKNDLAIQCNRNKEKIHIRDDIEEWLLIDDSEGLGELETIGSKALTRNIQVQNWWNDLKKHNFELTSSKTLEMFALSNNLIGQVTQNQLMNAENIKKHQKVLDDMLITLREIRNNLKYRNV